jgi:hypothetical protein
MNEGGRASETIPGLGLDEVMGCRETAVHSVPGLRTELHWAGTDIPGIKPGDRLPARLYEERLEPAGPQARVVARFPDGAPAAVLSTFGRGKALMLGSYLAVAYETQRDLSAERFFSGLLEWAGIERPVTVERGEVEVRWLESGAERIVFVFNHNDNEITPLISMRLPVSSATELATGASVPAVSARGAIRFRKRLGPNEVWVLRLR